MSLGLFFNSPIIITAAGIIGLGHYIFALITSIKGVQKINLASFFLMLLLVCCTVYYKKPPIVYYFGIHHIFSEAFARREESEEQMVFIARLVFYALNYSCLVGIAGHFHLFTYQDIFLAMVASFLFLCVLKKNNLKSLSSESLYLVLGILSYLHIINFGFYMIIFHHFFVWIFYPAFKMKDRGQIKKYMMMTIGLTSLSFLYITRLSFGYEMVERSYKILELGGYLHITMSFFLSKSNPQMIKQWVARPFAMGHWKRAF